VAEQSNQRGDGFGGGLVAFREELDKLALRGDEPRPHFLPEGLPRILEALLERGVGHAQPAFLCHRKAAGLPTGTLHVLRHTAATLALTNGVPVHVVAARLGDNGNTVLATYAHLLPQSDKLAAETVAALID
jgi:integrase